MKADEYKVHLLNLVQEMRPTMSNSESNKSSDYLNEYLSEHIGILQNESSVLPEIEGYGDRMQAIINEGQEGLDKIQRNDFNLTNKQEAGLEAIIRITMRPAILVDGNTFRKPPPEWEPLLYKYKTMIEKNIPSVGRINLTGETDLPWVGTGFLIADDVIMTNEHVAIDFCRRDSNGKWFIMEKINASIDFAQDFDNRHNVFEIKELIGIHEKLDIALFRISSVEGNGAIKPEPLVISTTFDRQIENRDVYLIGYPWLDDRRNPSHDVQNIFGTVSGVKRLQPGKLLRMADSNIVEHDCSTLGGNSGSCIIDLETNKVIALHFRGRYLEWNRAIALWKLTSDPLLIDAKANFG